MNLENTFLAAGAAEDMLALLAILIGVLLLYLVAKLGFNAGKGILSKPHDTNYKFFKNRNPAPPLDREDHFDKLTSKNQHDFLPGT